jgi:prepilin-type N-terminal cleavage/methylation domain-containing protein
LSAQNHSIDEFNAGCQPVTIKTGSTSVVRIRHFIFTCFYASFAVELRKRDVRDIACRLEESHIEKRFSRRRTDKLVAFPILSTLYSWGQIGGRQWGFLLVVTAPLSMPGSSLQVMDFPQMKNSRAAFTLVELLVVITIIGILMGLLIPAVNAARETARRNQCNTQLKNLALAAIQFENAKGELPGYIQEYGNYVSGTGASDPSDPTSAAPPSHVKLGTWAVALLPWLDAQPTYEHWTEDRYPIVDGPGGELSGTTGDAGAGFHSLASPNLAIMQCPSNPNSDGENGRNSYVSNNGMVPFNAAGSGTTGGITVTFTQSLERANGAFTNKFAGLIPPGVMAFPQPLGPRVRLDDFKDGQGNTILASENVQAMPWHRPGMVDATYLTNASVSYPQSSRYVHGMVWHYEDPQAPSGSTDPMASAWSNGGPQPVNVKHLINGRGNATDQDIFVERMTNLSAGTSVADLARPSSAHVDGVNAGMADGGTRFITDSIDYRVYQALLTLRGKSSDVPWPEFVLDDDAY